MTYNNMAQFWKNTWTSTKTLSENAWQYSKSAAVVTKDTTIKGYQITKQFIVDNEQTTNKALNFTKNIISGVKQMTTKEVAATKDIISNHHEIQKNGVNANKEATTSIQQASQKMVSSTQNLAKIIPSNSELKGDLYNNLTRSAMIGICHPGDRFQEIKASFTGYLQKIKNMDQQTFEKIEKKTAITIGVASGVAIIVGVSAPLIGFSTSGIVLGSLAAGMQAGIGNVVAGSAFAGVQSLAALGVFTTIGVVGVVGLSGVGSYYGGKWIYLKYKQ